MMCDNDRHLALCARGSPSLLAYPEAICTVATIEAPPVSSCLFCSTRDAEKNPSATSLPAAHGSHRQSGPSGLSIHRRAE
jgi:hypothetical protein